MAVYQVAFLFEAANDAAAQVMAERLSETANNVEEVGFADNAKIAFTKFEKEEDASK